VPFDDELVDVGGVERVEGLEAELVQDEQLEADKPTQSPARASTRSAATDWTTSSGAQRSSST
jgi:hypothetical protein